MVLQDHLRAVRYLELPVHVHAKLAQLADFLEERHRVQHHAIADNRLAVRPQHPARHQLQNKLFARDDDGVPGIVPARIPRHDVERARKHIDNLALAFIAPLGP